MADIFNVRIDDSGLKEIVRRAGRFSRRLPAEVANTTVFFVSRSWSRNMHRASTSSIDAELRTVASPRLLKSGRVSRAKNPRKVFAGGINAKYSTTVDLATLIVLARANLTKQGRATGISGYNARTSNRYAMAAAELAGKHGGWKTKLAALAHKLIATRHKSTAFLASSVKGIIAGLEPFVPAKYRRGADSPGEVRNAGLDKGHAEAAKPDQAQAQALISLDVGTAGTPGNLLPRLNEAMFRFGGPALQAAVNDEAARTARFVGEKEWEELVRNTR